MDEELVLPSTSEPVSYHPFSSEEIPARRRGMAITDLTVEIPSTTRTTSNPGENSQKQSRWGTLEFTLYYIVLCVVVPLMIWIPVTLSNGESRLPINQNVFS